jgi:CheY-like chemotaxis protein/MinD-like ATPase involved in chromosome partitioning or flagellar assembly
MAEKILIVDDDPDTVEFLNLLLIRQGYETQAAKNGLDALNLAHTQAPDLIILDVMMPGLDGFEVARSLRRHPATAMIPILMFTAKTQVEDKLAGYEAGVDIYLTKPVHPVELQANIKALLVKKQARAEEIAGKGYIVGVLAAKGGLGVSTVALNLAIMYHKKTNAKVIAAELRPGQGSWAQDLEISSPIGLTKLLDMSQPEISPSVINNLLATTSYGVQLLLASDQTKDVEYATALEQTEAIVQQLASLADLIVLDIGTNFLPAFEPVSAQCDEIILITAPQPMVVKRTRILVEELRAKSFGSAKVLTVVTLNHSRGDMTLPVSQIENMLGQSVTLGFPPATELAYLAAERTAPISLVQPGGVIAQQFTKLAEQLAKRISESPS